MRSTNACLVRDRMRPLFLALNAFLPFTVRVARRLRERQLLRSCSRGRKRRRRRRRKRRRRRRRGRGPGIRTTRSRWTHSGSTAAAARGKREGREQRERGWGASGAAVAARRQRAPGDSSGCPPVRTCRALAARPRTRGAPVQMWSARLKRLATLGGRFAKPQVAGRAWAVRVLLEVCSSSCGTNLQ